MSEDDCVVKIAVRERPFREILKNNDMSTVIDYHSSNSNILVVDDRPFAFDHVLPANITQQELFDFLVLPLIGKVLSGFNCTALAYGQTGTGKSFTMGLNPESLEGENVGVIPRCISAFLDKNKASDQNDNIELKVSFIEIYNEKVYDLLSLNCADPIIGRGYKFTGGTKVPITNILDGYALLNQGAKNRHVRPTKMNPQSSRSHAIFTIHVRVEMGNKLSQSCLNLVDLAGSEGVRRTGHQGVALSEGVNINQGLLSIGKVLQALTHGYKVIPYRDSVLSMMLQDSLNPNSYFTLLACISPHREDLSETLSTLRFAQKAKNLKHNPQINSKLMAYKRSRTPLKLNSTRHNQPLTTPAPYKVPFTLYNSKQSTGSKNSLYHPNAFSVPNKKNKIEISKFKTKEKQKIGSVQESASFEPSACELLPDRTDNTSLELPGSLLSLNISSSTAIETQPNQSNNFVMESTLEESLYQVLETIKSNHSPAKSKPIPCETSSYSLVEEIRNIVRQELMSFGEKTTNDKQSNKKVRCELFPESSPIFKVPKTHMIPSAPKLSSSQMLHSTQNESVLNVDETILSKPLRRSCRISAYKAINLTLIDSTIEDSVNLSKGRSTRYCTIKEVNEGRRRSIRLAMKKEQHQKGDGKDGDPPPSTHTSSKEHVGKKSGTRTKKQACPVNNTIIAGYFEESNPKPKNVKNALIKHQKAILEMLNSASMKELQFLPQVGLKTAFHIVTHRTLHGKFKDFTQVGKLPIWRGKAWQRFKEANNIS